MTSKRVWNQQSGNPLQETNTKFLFIPSVYLNKNPIYLMHKFELMAVIVLTFLKVVLEVMLNCVK